MDTSLFYSGLVTELPHNAVISLILVPIIQWAKQNPSMTWFDGKMALKVSALAAVATSLGIHANATGFSGTWISLGAGLLSFGKQFALNHWGSKTLDFVESISVMAQRLATTQVITEKTDVKV